MNEIVVQILKVHWRVDECCATLIQSYVMPCAFVDSI